MKHRKYGVLFVCLGNICRSPLGEGVFRHLTLQRGVSELFDIDSAGTSDYHIDERPHQGSIQVADLHGISIVNQRGRQFTREDLDKWDYIIVMDDTNRKDILNKFGKVKGNLHRLRDYDPQGPGDVPDPWGRGDEAFLDVYRIVHRSCEALLEHILQSNKKIRE